MNSGTTSMDCGSHLKIPRHFIFVKGNQKSNPSTNPARQFFELNNYFGWLFSLFTFCVNHRNHGHHPCYVQIINLIMKTTVYFEDR